MFSGIVEEVGRVRSVEPGGPDGAGRRLVMEAGIAAALQPGDSVAVDGVCQTVVAAGGGSFTVEAIGTTLGRTTLGRFEPGRRVNLERALAVGDRLGGHLVQGHVDGIGQVTDVRRRGEHVLLDFSLPEVVAEVTVLHGSIAVNGVSLTVNALPAPDGAQVAVIPYTWEHTNFPDLEPGAAVNLEGDMIGKFVIHHLRRTGTLAGARG